MRTTVTIILVLSLFPTLQSQVDPAAVKVLDQFSAQARAAPSVSMTFSLLTVDAIENRRDTIEGSLILSGNKYRLTLPESTTWFNGTDTWNYMPSVKEVTITRPEAGDNSFFSKPSLLYSMHREGYKPRMVEEKATEYIIDLYPEDISTDMIRIRLIIARPSLTLKSAEYKTRNGVTMTLKAKDYSLKLRPDGQFFVFDPSKIKGIEIIDMR
jgi:outer membrane lipoprotein carrier protein